MLKYRLAQARLQDHQPMSSRTARLRFLEFFVLPTVRIDPGSFCSSSSSFGGGACVDLRILPLRRATTDSDDFLAEPTDGVSLLVRGILIKSCKPTVLSNDQVRVWDACGWMDCGVMSDCSPEDNLKIIRCWPILTNTNAYLIL